jgi:mono/diheme cytochrome c family protein
MRYFFLAFLLSAVLVVGVAGFRGDKTTRTPIEIFDDMDHQAKVKAQSANHFFADGNGARLPVAGTVPMGASLPTKSAAEGGVIPGGFSHGSDYYNSGHLGDFYGDGFPEQVTIDAGFLRLGQERYNINCAVCHGESGNGGGRASKFGIQNIANFQTPAFIDQKDPAYRSNGSFFETITKGKGLMGAYGANIPVNERWAIIAWVRAMQSSRTLPLSNPAVAEVWAKLNPKSSPAKP